MTPEEQAARNILQHAQALHRTEHEYTTVDPADFRHLSLRFYDKAQRRLEARGFGFIADVEDVTISHASSAARVFVRVMVNQEGTIKAGLYHYRPPLKQRIQLWLAGGRNGKVIDFDTWLSDGTFLTTSNAITSGAIDTPPEFQTELLPAKTGIDELLTLHEERLEDYLSNHQGVRPVVIRNYEDAIRGSRAQNEVRRAFKKARGYVSREELRRLSGGDTDLADRIYDEIQKLLAEENNEESSMIQAADDPGSREQAFWNWFSENQDSLAGIETGEEPIAGQLMAKLESTAPGLSYEFGPGSEGCHAFFISPSGIADNIPAVESLHAAAPDIAGWEIVKYRQRKEPAELRLGDQVITCDTVFYVLRDEDEKIGIDLYFDDYNEALLNLYANIGFLFLDAALGEYDVMTKVGEINFLSTDDDRLKEGKPIRNLAEEFDQCWDIRHTD